MQKIAIAQVGTYLSNPTKTLDIMAEYTSRAAQQGAQLIVFPEAYIGGYPKGLSFGTTLGIRTPEGRRDFAQYASNACEQGDATYQQIAKLAKQHQIHLLTGIIEKSGGTLYCSSVLFSDKGEMINHRRKLMPTAQERVIWGQGDGKGLEVTKTNIGNIGAAICWENYMPLLRMALYSQNVELYCIPTVDDRETWQPTLRHIAREGRCFVISACQHLTADHYPANWQESSSTIRGGSCIIGPLGEYVLPPTYDTQDLLIADIELSEIIEGKFDLDVAGHYNRPDIFTFSWN